MKYTSKNILGQCSSLLPLLTAVLVANAFADDNTVDLGAVGTDKSKIDTIEVYATKGAAAAAAPTQSNLNVTEPQSIISRAFIENSVAPTGNFVTIATIAPSVAAQPSPNGPGGSDTKIVLRGLKDDFYNVTWDGIPFGDTNDPSHHSTAYFPAAVIGGVVVDRGPGNASTLGQATFGGSVNLFSKTPSAIRSTDIYGAVGSWNTLMEGIAYESGKFSDRDATLQLNAQNLTSNGYLQYNTVRDQNVIAKFQERIGHSSELTLFGTFNKSDLALNDGTGQGATLAQEALFGKSYGGLNNDPNSQGYWGYNQQKKTTNMEYAKIKTDWGNGFQTENTVYNYGYHNGTTSGYDATGYLGSGEPIDPNALANTGKFYKVELVTGTPGYNKTKGYYVAGETGVPGYDKLNEYQVSGDIFKATQRFDDSLLRVGFWYDHANTSRHNFAENVATGQEFTDDATYGLKSDQQSGWNQYQPFAEFEWAVSDTTTVTPGVKYVHFTRDVDASYNQGSKAPADFSETYITTLPFLTVNHQLDAQDAVYAQYAKGMYVPDLSYLQVATPTNSPDPELTTNYQLGYVHKTGNLLFDADIYYIDFNNYIGTVGTGNNTEFVNQGGAVYKGVEGQITFNIGSGLAAYLNGSINHADYKGSNGSLVPAAPTGPVPNAPKSTFATGLLYNDGPWNGSLIYKHTGEQYTGNASPSPQTIGGYGNIDINVAYTINNPGLGMRKLRIQGSIFNVANSQNVTTISTTNVPGADDLYTWQAPRSFMVSAKGTF